MALQNTREIGTSESEVIGASEVETIDSKEVIEAKVVVGEKEFCYMQWNVEII